MAVLTANASGKPRMRYVAKRGVNPRTGGEIWYPYVTDRNTLTTGQVVQRGIDAQQMRGKFHDLLGIVNGFNDAVKVAVSEGYSVQIGDWYEVFLTLNGTLPTSSSRITAANGVHTSLNALNDLRVDMDAFEWENVTDTANAIHVSYITYVGATCAPGTVAKGQKIRAVGSSMVFLSGDSVTLSWPGEDNDVVQLTLTPESSEYGTMVFAWPSTLDTAPVGTRLTFDFRTRGGVADGPYRTTQRTVTLVAAAA